MGKGNNPTQQSKIEDDCENNIKDTSPLNGDSKEDGNNTDGKDSKVQVAAPDGGWGWMVVLSSFLIHVIADGVVYSFGVFLTEFVDYFHAGRGSASWVGSLQPAVTFTVGPLSSMLTNHYGCRVVTIAGAIVAGAGFVLSIWAPNLYYLYLTAGVMAGLGFGLIYLPAIVCVAQYFEKRRSFATGLAVCGSGFGTFILAPITEMLVKEYQWQGAMLIIGGIILNIIVCGIIFRPLDSPPQNESTLAEEEKLLSESKEGSNNVKSTPTINVVVEKDYDINKGLGEITNGGDLVVESNKNYLKGPSSEVVVISSMGKSDKGNFTIEQRSLNRMTASQCLHPSKDDSVTQVAKMVASESALHRLKANKKTTNIRQRVTDKKHLAPPVSVKDIPYTGSMHSIPLFCSHPDMHKTITSTHSIHESQQADKANKEAEVKKGLWHELKQTTAEMLSPDLLRNPVFIMFGVSNFFTSIGFNVPFIFLPDRAIVSGIDKDKAVFLVSIIGIANTLGRMIFGFLSDRPGVNRLVLYNTALTICGVATSVSVLLDSFYLLAVYAAVFGIFIGVYVSLTPVVLVDLLGLELLTNAFGLLLLFQGAATFVGPPMAGWLFDYSGSYTISFIVMGILIAFSGSMLFFLPCVQRYYKKKNISDDNTA